MTAPWADPPIAPYRRVNRAIALLGAEKSFLA
jgi:hypothetical protein